MSDIDQTQINEVVEFLQNEAETIPYLDPDYNIIVLGCCTKPFIVMGIDDFSKLERRVIG